MSPGTRISDLGQHRIILVRGSRQQIFRQMKQKPQEILCVFSRIFVQSDETRCERGVCQGLCGVAQELGMIDLRLTDRDRRILRTIQRFRFVRTNQVQRLFFRKPSSTPRARLTSTTKLLHRLESKGLIAHLDRKELCRNEMNDSGEG